MVKTKTVNRTGKKLVKKALVVKEKKTMKPETPKEATNLTTRGTKD